MKVLVVDDEYVIRIGLQSMINWEENGFYLVGTASNGSHAMELIMEHKPDVVITDIKMPVMDGIELMENLSKLNDSPRFVVLSNHNDFQLVRKALKLGAEDYLLKLEIEPDELINMLKRIEIKVNQQKSKTQENKKSRINSSIGRSILQKNFLRDFLHNFNMQPEELDKTMASLDIRLNRDYVYCIMIKAGELYRFEDISNDELHMLNFSVINIAEEIVNSSFNGYCLEGKTGEFFIFFSSKKSDGGQVSEKRLRQLGANISDMIEQYLNIPSVVGIGEGKDGILGIKSAYQGSLKAVRCRFFNTGNKVILWQDVHQEVLQIDNYSLYEEKEKLYKALDFHNAQDIESLFKKVREDIKKLKLSKNAVCNILLELFTMLREYIENYQIESSKIMKKSYCTYQQLACIESIFRAEKWLDNLREDLLQYIEEEEKVVYSRLISKAKAYIEEYFCEQLTLKQVADKVNLNPSYLSTLLKRYTGKSYSEYITMIRVEKAKTLLSQSEDKVYEVGEKVGYHNIYYFNRIFKKTTGVTPGEYKRMQP